MGIENLMTFMITALLFIITPGIDTIFVLNKSVSQGRKSGIYAALGINAGILTHTFFAALGLSVIIAKSAFALILIKYLGAAYLIYLGYLKFKNKKTLFPTHTENVSKHSKNEFWTGFVTNTLNPKVALFFLAFFPQFIEAKQINNPIPFLLLGVTYALIGVAWFLFLSLFASIFSQKIQSNQKSSFWMNKLSGLIFIIMGIHIAISQT